MNHMTHLLSSGEAHAFSLQLQDLSGWRWHTSAHAFFVWNQRPKKLIIVRQWQDVLDDFLTKGVFVWRLACLCCVPTCCAGGFQRMFLSGAGVNPAVPVGLFLRSRITPLGSSRSLTTRFFSCHPTWCTDTHTHTHKVGVINARGVWNCSNRGSVCGSHDCLKVDLDDLITGVDLSGQVCRRLGRGETNKKNCLPTPKVQTNTKATQAAC